MLITLKFILIKNQTRILSMSAVGPLHVGDFCQSTANAVAKSFTQQTSAVFISHQGDWRKFVIVGTHVIFENYNNQHIKITHFVAGLHETCHNVWGLHVTD